MKFGIYLPDVTNELAESLVSGVRTLHGTAVLRNSARFTPEQVEDFDVVIVQGAHQGAQYVPQSYADRKVPVILIENGFLARDRGYHQIVPESINNIIVLEKETGDARYKIVEKTLPPILYSSAQTVTKVGKPTTKSDQSQNDPEEFLLILGQMPGDMQHGLSEKELLKFFDERLEKLSDKYSKIVYRPHPLSIKEPKFCVYTEFASPKDCALEDLIVRCGAVLTYNSTAAYYAMVAKKPILSSEAAIYSGVAVKDYQSFLSRVCLNQFTYTEIQTGMPLKRVLSYFSGTCKQ